ncbi:hypothetical protein ACWDCW_28615, partial [Streptomyces sp. NPDC001221]
MARRPRRHWRKPAAGSSWSTRSPPDGRCWTGTRHRARRCGPRWMCRGGCIWSGTMDVVALGESMVTFVPSGPGGLADVPSFQRGIG